MSELLEHLREEFRNQDRRNAYADTFTNAFIAAQVKANREAQGLSQGQLAELIGTKQSGISRLENVNYSSWKVETLRKLAKALDLRLRISFEEFGTLIPEIKSFGKRVLVRRRFLDDPVFNPTMATAHENVLPTTVGRQGSAEIPAALAGGMVNTEVAAPVLRQGVRSETMSAVGEGSTPFLGRIANWNVISEDSPNRRTKRDAKRGRFSVVGRRKRYAL